MHDLAQRLWSIPRSITGNGVRQTLRELQNLCPNLTIHEVPSGTEVLDWRVPDEWNLRRATLTDPDGCVVADTDINNLHVVGYSEPVHRLVSLEELQNHLHSIPEQPDAIPYVTSYYERRWGFCLAHRDRESLKPGTYEVKIDTRLTAGSLSYGEIIIPGDHPDEVFISTYVCHPSMANNELSGPVVAAEIARWLTARSKRRFTYRIVFIPETIGSITYLARHLSQLKERVRAGFNVTCVGDERAFSYLPSRNGSTLADTVARHVLEHASTAYTAYTWLDRGSDERQYCAPGIDLPVVSMMRSKYWEYPEYHTSLDDLDSVVTPVGLAGGFALHRLAVEILERNSVPTTRVLGEPQLGRRGLYSTLGAGRVSASPVLLLDVLSFCDGKYSTLEIARIVGRSFFEVADAVDLLASHDLVDVIPTFA